MSMWAVCSKLICHCFLPQGRGLATNLAASAASAASVHCQSRSGRLKAAHLDLDVTRILHQLLDEHAPVPKGSEGLGARALKAVLQAVVCTCLPQLLHEPARQQQHRRQAG